MRSKFEKMCHKELQADGWFVDYKASPRMTPPNYNRDYFNLFDILAWKPNIVRWIAIKGQGGVPKALRDGIEAFEMGLNNVKELWTYSQPTRVGKRIKNAKYRVRKEIL